MQELEAAAASARNSGANRRKDTRQPLPEQLIVRLQIKQPGGTEQCFIVPTRNLSNTGISILHGGFVHEHTCCEIQIYDGEKPLVRIPAKVVYCRYLRKTAHEIGLRFDKPIDAEAVMKCEPTPDLSAEHDAAAENAEKTIQLVGRVLHVDPLQIDRRFTNLRLAQWGLTFVDATTSLEAVTLANQQNFDLVICSHRLEPDPGLFVIRRLRKGGMKTPFIMTGHNITREETNQLTGEGVHACFSKPLKYDELGKVLRGLLPEAQATTKVAAGLSRHWADIPTRPLIIDYLNGITDTVEQLSQAILNKAGDESSQCVVQQFAASATLYGFPQISENANELATLLAMTPLPTDMIREQIDDLHKLAKTSCRAIT